MTISVSECPTLLESSCYSSLVVELDIDCGLTKYN